MKQDEYIMDTNDSSIVSKRSVARFYLKNEPDFFEPFVKKLQRRHPLINRGYWLRIQAIDYGVLHFLRHPSLHPRKKVIVNLGCGYDPLPFRFWHNHPELSEDAIFIDIDYPQLMQKKKQMILESNVLGAALPPGDLVPLEGDVLLRHPRYLTIGCDLHQLAKLQQVLEEELSFSEQSILFVAEVSIAYMSVEGADAVIRWASSFKDSQFCLLEQCLPDGPDHPFAQTMIKHFDKLRTPLRIIHSYENLSDQRHRFMSAGWPQVDISSLWDFWHNDHCIPPELRRSLDSCEPFDEWEEFALFGGHYFLLIAGKEGHVRPPFEGFTDSRERCVQTRSSATVASAPSDGQSRSDYTAHSADSDDRRRYAAAFNLNGTAVALHGGLGAQARVNTCQVYPRNESLLENVGGPPLPESLMCHTITNLNDDECLMVGGRTSPSHASSRCWFRGQGQWKEVQPLLPGRFRHCAVKVHVNAPEGPVAGVLVYGGRSSTGEVLQDSNLWTPTSGWKKVPVHPDNIPARFGASLATTNDGLTEGILFGGLSAGGEYVTDCWTWRLHVEEFPMVSCVKVSGPIPNTLCRFGASLVHSRWGPLLIGGVSQSGCLKKKDEVAVIDVNIEESRIEARSLDIIPSDSSRPLLVGSSAATLANSDVIVAGGGAVCFSFGSLWNTGYFRLTRRDGHTEPLREAQELQEPLSLPYSEPSGHTNQSQHSIERNKSGAGSPVETTNPVWNSLHDGTATKSTDDPVDDVSEQPRESTILPQVAAVPRIHVITERDFDSLLNSRQPAVIEGLDIGSCTSLWTLDGLKDRIGADRPVIVHSCPTERMTFQTKNFSYTKQAFGDFLKAAESGEKLYLRSVASKQPAKHPTNLGKDFPTIAADFKLPPQLAKVTETMHSSPLRISGPVTLWLHYDVMANVLCQVRGTKTLRLYPPADVIHLDFPPGASSSNINVFTSDHAPLRYTHPHEVALRPGDVLFIPPLWAHTATPTDGVSVAVNVFFRNLEEGYAAGRDVYGNRDLQAYENGRRDVEKIVKAFEGLPKDMSRFYLERLVAEFKEKAELVHERLDPEEGPPQEL
ncbi:tRNA methyltransferase ppm2 [Coniosporium tulheliwenetii]|uniref:tRNA methyltransferase ppm2 n=1 Tax=Coniosporium tulheliwenetii TaxID=3383036 RepID=A0ACC2ZA78_9PEZI|nr:tRNA methyltransferase ppm2 [Cladosporium sp. JES 115]